jgi:signal transduction histidine kinase
MVRHAAAPAAGEEALAIPARRRTAPPASNAVGDQQTNGRALAGVVEELREISRGIHPAILSRDGLDPALRALARRSAVPVKLDLRTERRLPEHVEVAAYYVVSGALTNAAKHAHASAVQVELDAPDAIVRLAIRDDGIGGADPRQRSGRHLGAESVEPGSRRRGVGGGFRTPFTGSRSAAPAPPCAARRGPTCLP